MNKKGDIFLAVFAGMVVCLTVAGAFFTIYEGNKLYVGDKQNNFFYDYSKCPSQIDKILPENRTVFESEGLAIKSGFKPMKGCI